MIPLGLRGSHRLRRQTNLVFTLQPSEASEANCDDLSVNKIMAPLISTHSYRLDLTTTVSLLSSAVIRTTAVTMASLMTSVHGATKGLDVSLCNLQVSKVSRVSQQSGVAQIQSVKYDCQNLLLSGSPYCRCYGHRCIREHHNVDQARHSLPRCISCPALDVFRHSNTNSEDHSYDHPRKSVNTCQKKREEGFSQSMEFPRLC